MKKKPWLFDCDGTLVDRKNIAMRVMQTSTANDGIAWLHNTDGLAVSHRAVAPH